MKLIHAISCLLSAALIAAQSGCGVPEKKDSISTDTTVIAAGALSFEKNCRSCHNFRQDGIGPQLAGITEKRPASWIVQFVRNPAALIASGDKHAQELHLKYKAMMPGFESLGDREIQSIVSFLHTQKQLAANKSTDSNIVADPYPPIPRAGITLQLESFLQIPASAKEAPLARITKIAAQPGTGDLCILDLNGKLYKVIGSKPVVYMDMSKLEPYFIPRPGLGSGFGSFAFHPGFKKNGLLYTTHTERANRTPADFAYNDSIKVTLQWVLTEWKVNHPGDAVFSGQGRELLRVNMVGDIHGVQEICFNSQAQEGYKDYGMLYICTGDGGSVENGYPFLPHHKSRIWGTVIRIDPKGNNSRNKKYGIPADNPFVHDADTTILKEIYCYGFRNPHRISWTRKKQMLVYNIGQHDIESIYLAKPGHDYGWPIREGNFLIDPYADINAIYPLPANDSAYHIDYPIAAYDHDEGKAIAGGYEYTGRAIAMLNNKILFADIPTGRIFYIEANAIQAGQMAPIKAFDLSINGKPQTLIDACGNERVEIRLGEDAAGEIYVMTKADGKVYKLTGAKKTGQ